MPTKSITIAQVQSALALPDFDAEAAHVQMFPAAMSSRERFQPPPDARKAGVLVLLFPEDDQLQLVLTQRSEQLRGVHSGQISFPGGRRDPEDATFEATALRETREELGIDPATIHVIGSLTSIYIPPSNFEVHPTVGTLESRPEFQPNPAEVAEAFTVPLGDLLDEGHKQQEYYDFGGTKVLVPFYAFNGYQVWGATAIMLSEFEHRLRAVTGE